MKKKEKPPPLLDEEPDSGLLNFWKTIPTERRTVESRVAMSVGIGLSPGGGENDFFAYDLRTEQIRTAEVDGGFSASCEKLLKQRIEAGSTDASSHEATKLEYAKVFFL